MISFAPMTRHTPLLRVPALLLALLQLALPAASAVADGRIAARAGDPVAHVESTSSATCPVVHPPDCAVCRYLSAAAVPTAAAPDACALAPAVSGSLAARRSGNGVLVGLPDSRAQPLV